MIVLDTNMKLFADRMHITSQRMVEEYGLKSVDDIIEAEAEKGNKHAVEYAMEMYKSPAKLIQIYRLYDVENKFVILKHMKESARNRVISMLEPEDLVMGLYFFTQEKLLEMLMNTDIAEVVNVAMEAFPYEEIIKMYSEEDLAQFFQHDKLDKNDVIKQLNLLPPEVMRKFLEGVTGRPAEETNPEVLINSIASLPDDKYRDFMSAIDPDVQRQLVFQLGKEKPEYMQLFKNGSYVDMMSQLMKPDMVKPMIALDKDTLAKMISELPDGFISIVCAQVDTQKFAYFLLEGHYDVLKNALMV